MRSTIGSTCPNGLWTPKGDAVGAREIAMWFANDIQYGKSNVDRAIKELADIQSGIDPDGYLGAGNAHEISANRDYTFLQCIFVPELKVLMTHAQARDALLKYRAFLAFGVWDAAQQPPPFEVEYLAEGAEAERRAKNAGLDFIEVR